MAQIISWPSAGGMDDPDDLDCLDRAGLLVRLERVRKELARLDEEEPEDMDSEAYQIWGDAHEALEDLADEIMERLEE